MNKKQLIELAESHGATHKQSLGVYQFFEHELESFVQSFAYPKMHEGIKERCLFLSGLIDDEGKFQQNLEPAKLEERINLFGAWVMQSCIKLAQEEEDRYLEMNEDLLAMAMENYQLLLKERFGE